MLYSRIDLSKTNYTDTYSDWKFVVKPDKTILNQIYTEYCRYKKRNQQQNIKRCISVS